MQIQSLNKQTYKDNDIVCFCFNYTKKNIIDDYLSNNNRSSILEKIKTEKQNDGCDCKVKNPKGI